MFSHLLTREVQIGDEGRRSDSPSLILSIIYNLEEKQTIHALKE